MKLFKQFCKELAPERGVDMKEHYAQQLRYIGMEDEDDMIDLRKFKMMMTRNGLKLGKGLVEDFLGYCKVKDGKISLEEIANKLGSMSVLT